MVTSLQYRLDPVGPTVLAGMVLHPLEKAKEVLKFYGEFNSAAPEEMSAWAARMTSPEGRPVPAVVVCCVGPREGGEKVARPLKVLGPPMADLIQPMPYVKVQSMFDGSFPQGRYNYWRSNVLRELSDDAIDTLVGRFKEVTSPYSIVLIIQLGGAVKRFGSDGTALNHRSSPCDLVITPARPDPAESQKHIRWADQLWRAMQPFSSGGVYVNYLSNEGEERVKAVCSTNYERLVSLKNKYDPRNLFRFNQNIRPRPRVG